MRAIVTLSVLGLALATQSASAHTRGDQHASVTAVDAKAAGAVAVVEAFHAAMARGDLAGVAALMAEDAVVFEHGGVERTKAEYVARHLPDDAAYMKDVADTVVSRTARVESALAYVITEGRSRGGYDGKAVDRLTTETMILRKTNAGWRIVHIHWSSGKAVS